MCYPVCQMVHIKDPMLLIGKTGADGAVGMSFAIFINDLENCLNAEKSNDNIDEAF